MGGGKKTIKLERQNDIKVTKVDILRIKQGEKYLRAALTRG